MASAYSQGLTTAAVGAYSAAFTWSDSPGSTARAPAPDSSARSGTPFSTPRRYSSSSVRHSSSEKASTRLPVRRNGTFSFWQISAAWRLPSTFSRAIWVPGAGS